MKNKKPVTKKWVVELADNGDFVTLNRTNEGFTAYELLGILTQAKENILKQMAGEIKPDIINRKVIEDK